MSTLIISNRMNSPEHSTLASAHWVQSRPSAEAYDTVILDLYFGRPAEFGFSFLDREAHFYELGTEVARALQGGAVVIALLGPVAVTARTAELSYIADVARLKQHNKYDTKCLTERESSYDWLDQGFLRATQLDHLHAKCARGMTIVLPYDEIQRYMWWAETYWLSILGVDPPTGATVDRYLRFEAAQSERWGCYFHQNCQAKVLTIGSQTKLPVAAAIRYMNWDGLLLLLPAPELKQSSDTRARSEEVLGLVGTLESLGKKLRGEFAKRETGEHEEWVFEHRAPKAKDLGREIEQLKQQQEEHVQELIDYDAMLSLLDGTNDSLVEGVASLLDSPGEGIYVERTEKGASIDLFVTDSLNRKLVVEVTGIEGALKKGDPHWADFLQYRAEHEEVDEDGNRVERLVLVVNTQRKTTLGERNRSTDITRGARDLLADNHICIVRACDLYAMWLGTLDGQLTVKDVFNTIFDCEGVYEPSEHP